MFLGPYEELDFQTRCFLWIEMLATGQTRGEGNRSDITKIHLQWNHQDQQRRYALAEAESQEVYDPARNGISGHP
jgi:hypothetical protein